MGTFSDEWDNWQDDGECHMFPLDMPLQFRVCGALTAVAAENQQGSGHTVYMSSSAVQFESEKPLEVGMEVELFIAWPAKLNRFAALTLRVRGRIQRASGIRAELKTENHEFYTRLYKHAG